MKPLDFQTNPFAPGSIAWDDRRLDRTLIQNSGITEDEAVAWAHMDEFAIPEPDGTKLRVSHHKNSKVMKEVEGGLE